MADLTSRLHPVDVDDHVISESVLRPTDGPFTFFAGLVDEVRFYNVALKPTVVSVDEEAESVDASH